MSVPSSPMVTDSRNNNISISDTNKSNSSIAFNNNDYSTTTTQKQDEGSTRRNSSRLIPLPTPPKQSNSDLLNTSQHTRPIILLKQHPPVSSNNEQTLSCTSSSSSGMVVSEVVRNAKVSATDSVVSNYKPIHDESNNTKKKEQNNNNNNTIAHKQQLVHQSPDLHQPSNTSSPESNQTIILGDSLSSPNSNNNPTPLIHNSGGVRVRALSCDNSESSPSIETSEQQTKPRTMSTNSLSSFLNNNQPSTSSTSCPLPDSSLSQDQNSNRVVFSHSLSPPKSSKIGVPIMKKYPSMKDDLISKTNHNNSAISTTNNFSSVIMYDSDYTSLMKTNESICLDCRNIGCKCIVVTMSNENKEERDVALDLIGTVLLTTNRIIFLIDEDMSLNQYPTNGHVLPKMIEVQLANIEVIEKNLERNMCMTITEKSDSSNGENSPPPIRLIKKYEFFAFDSASTFQRAFKTFNDMLNVIRLENANGKVLNHLQHVKSKDALATLKKSYLSKKRVSVDQPNVDTSTNSSCKKFLSPLEEAITNNFSIIEGKICTPPSNKTKFPTIDTSKHRRSISLNSPIHYDTSKQLPNGNGNSDLSDYEERRTFISDHVAHGSTSHSEHSADETEPKKRRSKKKDKSSSSTIPNLLIEPPSQLFDEQFDCMIDEIAHNFTNNIQIEVNDIFKPTAGKKNPKTKTLLTKSLVGISASEVFQLFFSSSSTFLRQAHEKVGDQEIEIYDWVDFQIGSPSVRGITYKVGGAYPNHFSAFTNNSSRILETQRIVVIDKPPKINSDKQSEDIPMSYFILSTSAATQDLPNNQMFQFDIKYIVKDVKPSNLLLRKECEIQITGTSQCKGGTFFWRSKSTESSVLKAVKNRLLIMLSLMEEKIQSIVDEKRSVRDDQQSKAWEATVMSTMVSLDGGFPKHMPPLNNLLPPPQCLDSSPPPTPRGPTDDFSDSSDEDLTYGSTISMIGSENEFVNKRIKTVGHSSTSHLTITPPAHSLSNVSLDMSPTFDNAIIKPKKVPPSPLTNSTLVENIDEQFGEQNNHEASHSSLTITDERPSQLTSPGPIFIALWEFLIMLMEQGMGYISTISSYLAKEVVEPAIKLSWDMKDTVFTILILVIVFSLLFNNYSAINRLDVIKKDAQAMQHELSLKYMLSKSIIYKIMDPQSTKKTPKEMEYSIRELVKEYLFENRKLHPSVVKKKDLMSQMILFKQVLNERRTQQSTTSVLIKQSLIHSNQTTKDISTPL